MKRVELVIEGRVQGVFYRGSAEAEARRRRLSGWVRNRDDGSVELAAEGDEAALRELVAWCQNGPPGAQVTAVKESWSVARGEVGFRVVR